MPNDDIMIENEALIKNYAEVRLYFATHPDLEAVPLLLNSFGDGSGFGMYARADETIWHFSPQEILPHLVKALNSEYHSVRYWCTQIAMSFPDQQLIAPLENVLQHDDIDARAFAASTLSLIPGKRVDEILLTALNNEQENEVLEAITEALETRPYQE
jgi:HEAT repeat protein